MCLQTHTSWETDWGYIKLLTEEVNKLRNLVQYMALELSKNVQKEVAVIETNENTVTNKETEAFPSDHSFKCDKC